MAAAATTRLLALGALALALILPSAARATCPTANLGVYVGAAKTERVQDFAHYLGHPVSGVLDYLPSESWDSLEDASFWGHAWAQSGHRILLSVPMLPDGRGSLRAGARGLYDRHFKRLARSLVKGGLGDAVLRIGWEFNADFFRWSSERRPAAYAAYWRHIVRAMRKAKGQRFEFDWTAALGTGISPESAYPGSAYVDYVGLDVYDEILAPGLTDPAVRWQDFVNRPYGLGWQASFAADHGKRLSFPEWALVLHPDGSGGGDDEYFVQAMYDWIDTHDVAYHNYFNYDDSAAHSITAGHFPNASSTFRKLLGAKTLTDWHTCEFGL